MMLPSVRCIKTGNNSVDAQTVGIQLSGAASLFSDFDYISSQNYFFSAWIYFLNSATDELIFSITTQTVSGLVYTPQLQLIRNADTFSSNCAASGSSSSFTTNTDGTWYMIFLALHDTDQFIGSEGANGQSKIATETRCALTSHLKLSVGSLLSSTNTGSSTLNGVIREVRVVQNYTGTYEDMITQLLQNVNCPNILTSNRQFCSQYLFGTHFYLQNALVTNPPVTTYQLDDLYGETGITAVLGLKTGSASITTSGTQHFLEDFSEASVTNVALSENFSFLFQFQFSTLADYFPLMSTGPSDLLTLQLKGMSSIDERLIISTSAGSLIQIQLTQTIISSTVYTFCVQFRKEGANTYEVKLWLNAIYQGTAQITLNQPMSSLNSHQMLKELPGKAYFAFIVPSLTDTNLASFLLGTNSCASLSKVFQPETASCETACSSSTFIDNSNNICTVCTSNCANCASLTTCDTCTASYFLQQNLKCAQNCPSGQGPDNSNACQTCITLGQVYQPQLDQCQNSCTSSTFINTSNNHCETCTSDCAQCSSLTTCSDCNSPYLVNSDYKCTLVCSTGYTPNQNNVCEQNQEQVTFDTISVAQNNEISLIFSQRVYLADPNDLISQSPNTLDSGMISLSISGKQAYSFSYQVFAQDYDSSNLSFLEILISLKIIQAISAYDSVSATIVLNPSYLLTLSGAVKSITVNLGLNPQYSTNALVDQATMESAAEGAAIMTQSIMGSNIFLSLIMDFSLKFLWSSINTAQLVQFLPLLCQPMPSNTRTVFLELSFANGDFKFLQFLKSGIRNTLSIKESDISGIEPLDLCFQNNDFESTSFFLNVEGKLYLIFLYLLIIIPLLLVLYLICLCIKCKKIALCCKGYLSLNTLLRTYIELFLELFISSLVGFYTISFKNPSDSLSSFFCLFTFLFCIFFVTLALLLIVKDIARYKRNQDHKRTRLFLADLNLSDKKCMRSLYFPFFLLQRIFYSLVLVLLRTYTYLQIALLLCIFTAMLIYMIAVKPFQSKIQNFLVSLESVTFIVVCFLLLGLTLTQDEITDSLKQILGFVIIGVVLACLMTGIMIAIIDMCREIRKKCKKKKNREAVQDETGMITQNSKTEIGDRFKEETHEIELDALDGKDARKKETNSVMLFKRIRGKRKLPHDQ